ncbi:MAG TPA: hypothetical protein VFV31_00135 [Chitinophagaceae bacterium]|nr:hypothetical protein [Chitinophagaceae bacterium]
MSLEQQWKQLDEQGDEELRSLLQPRKLQRLQSRNPLQKIKSLIVAGLIFSVAITALYGYLLVAYPYWPITVSLIVVIGFNVWVSVTSWQLYRQINPFVQEAVLQEMQHYYNSVMNWYRLQERVALFVYPVALAGGFLLGGMEGSGKSIEQIMSKPIMWVALGICMLILVPLCWWFARWMFRKSFGRYLKQLKQNMDALSSPG